MPTATRIIKKKWISNPSLDEKANGNKAMQEISACKLFWRGIHAILVLKSVLQSQPNN